MENKAEKYYHKKLIRDKIPDLIISSGNECETRIMNDTEFEVELKKKLLEEAKEVGEAPDDKLLSELADVLQTIMSIASQYNISFDEVIQYQIDKENKRGAFSKKIFLEWSTQPRGN